MNYTCVLARLVAVLATACADYSGQVVIAVDQMSLSPELVDATHEAMGVWESRTGLDLFTPLGSAIVPHVLVKAMPEPCTWDGKLVAGHTTVHWDFMPGSMEGLVWLCPSVLDSAPDEYVLGTAVHELGHVLRLDHSDDPGNVMRAAGSPDAPDWTISDEQIEQIRDTTHDVAVIR